MGNDSENAGLVVWMIGSLGVIGIGVFLVTTPAKHFLLSDRKTGYWIYCKTLERTDDEMQAVAAAAIFYRIFGGAFAAIGGISLVIAAAMLFASLMGIE